MFISPPGVRIVHVATLQPSSKTRDPAALV
jgi:hypothetical protein